MVVNDKASRNDEINNRLSKALTTCGKLKEFLKKTKCPIKWKYQVYNAIIVSQLLYGLNTINITEAVFKRLDAFQARGLRHILNIEHSFYSNISNEEVFNRINLAINNADPELEITWENFIVDQNLAELKQVKKLSELIKERQQQLFHHVIRCDSLDLLKQPAIDQNMRRPTRNFKRVGRPKNNWVNDNLEYTFQQFKHLLPENESEHYNHNVPEHPQLVQHVAMARLARVTKPKAKSRRRNRNYVQRHLVSETDVEPQTWCRRCLKREEHCECELLGFLD